MNIGLGTVGGWVQEYTKCPISVLVSLCVKIKIQLVYIMNKDETMVDMYEMLKSKDATK